MVILTETVANGQERPPLWQFDVLAAWLDVAPLEELKSYVEIRDHARIFALATAAARDSDVDESLRVAAIQLIAREPELRDTSVALVRQLLSPRQSPAIQAAVVSRLSNRTEPAVAEELLRRWRNYSPALRNQVVNVLLSREPWIGTLLDAIASQHVLSSDLNAVERQRMLNQKKPEFQERARKLFAASSTADREAVIDKYRVALELTADLAVGKKVFADKCASCHRLGDVGKEIGPNLLALTDKSPAALLSSMLDPNRAVEAKYLSYNVADNDGRTHSGLIKTETATSITLVTSEAKEVSILRSEIEDMTSSGMSLMPDGLEKELSVQDVADLLGYVLAQK